MAFSRGPKIVTDGLVLALDAASHKSYPGSGTTWYDLSGNSNSNTLNNSPSFISDSSGAVSFDGTDDSGDFNSAINFDDNTPFSAHCAISIPYFTGQNLSRVHWISGSGGNSMMIFRNTSFFMWNEAGGANNLSISYTFPVNQIFLATVTRDSSNTVSLYVNGEYINQGSRSGQFRWTTIARLGSSSTYCSRLDLLNMMIYNKELTAEEVQQNYNATKGRFDL